MFAQHFFFSKLSERLKSLCGSYFLFNWINEKLVLWFWMDQMHHSLFTYKHESFHVGFKPNTWFSNQVSLATQPCCPLFHFINSSWHVFLLNPAASFAWTGKTISKQKQVVWLRGVPLYT